MADDVLPAGNENALAQCGTSDANNPPGCLDGYIAFGNAFYTKHVSAHGQSAMWGTLAHEFGHRVQQTQPWWNDARYVITIGSLTNASVVRELEADAFSGYYAVLGRAASQQEIDELYTHAYSIGDNQWTNAQWHGTQFQRYAAAYIGVGTALNEATYNVHYNYQQLHDMFVTTILTDILQHPDGSVVSMSVAGKEGLARLPHEKLRQMALGKRRW